MGDDIYRKRILENYKYPHNFGRLKKFTHRAGHRNISCGDQIQMYVRIVKNRISNVSFTGEGCAISVASASLLTDMVKNRALSGIQKMSLKDIKKLLHIPISPAREKCALLALETLQKLQRKTKK